MAIKFEEIENILVKRKNESSLEGIIIAYASLKQKIDNLDNQSQYFKQGEQSSRGRLVSLNNDYEVIKNLFNESTLDFLIEQINQNSSITSSYEAKPRGAIQLMHCSYLIDESAFFTELLRLKSKTELLMPLDYYLENPEKFLMFIE